MERKRYTPNHAHSHPPPPPHPPHPHTHLLQSDLPDLKLVHADIEGCARGQVELEGDGPAPLCRGLDAAVRHTAEVNVQNVRPPLALFMWVWVHG